MHATHIVMSYICYFFRLFIIINALPATASPILYCTNAECRSVIRSEGVLHSCIDISTAAHSGRKNQACYRIHVD